MATNCSNIPGLAFYDALVENSLEELKRRVELHRIDLNARLSHVRKRNHTDLCPVHLVAYKGYFAMLHYLIQSGVNVHQPTSTLQRRAVHFAALRHQVSCLQMLLNAGAQLDVRDTFGNTPLHYAAEDGDVGLLSLLLNNGASVDSQDITSKTPLMKAARSGKLWAVRRLIAFGANVNVKDRNDETALHFACRQGSTEITGMLIKAGARLNAQNQSGLTPMMEAVSYNQREAVSLLVKQRDVDLYKRDFTTGDTALHIAVKKNYIHMVEILLQAGNWYIEYNYNNLGESFVHDVVAYNRLELLRLFLAYNYDFDRPAKRLPVSLIGYSSCKLVGPTGLQTAYVASSSEASSTSTSTIGLNVHEKSPFQLALERGHLDLARILADVGCFRVRLPINSGPLTTQLSTSCLSSISTTTPGWYSFAGNNTNSPLVRRYSGLLEVKSLKKWCRRRIRQMLGFRMTEALPLLPLPVALKDFLLLRDIDWSVCWTNALTHRSSPATGDLAIIVPPR
ncbi:Ankyrin repeat domain-containing protein 6 [Paragonimus heterotremus]|uniref:Ankyrin repeat domain-containing protein 6 n=1 Tax=Paragonimus heterotremus TaxID=100268 RepID=A0A8J4SNZ3_9TREM|nr:Ankyrin repeat domain-containing protein 6 [Paragonimus heterotremus]